MANDDGPTGEMVRIFRQGQGDARASTYGLKPEVAILDWMKPDMAPKGIFDSVDKWYKSTTNSDVQNGVDSHGYPVSCDCPWCASCKCPTCNSLVEVEKEMAEFGCVMLDDDQ